MRANIIIHSVTGNLLLIAKVFQEKLQEKGVDARIYRVEDPDLHLSAAESNEANEYYEDIISLPLLRKGDVTIMGCPAIFSLPTAEMKAFLDQTIPLLDSRDMENRLFKGIEVKIEEVFLIVIFNEYTTIHVHSERVQSLQIEIMSLIYHQDKDNNYSSQIAQDFRELLYFCRLKRKFEVPK